MLWLCRYSARGNIPFDEIQRAVLEVFDSGRGFSSANVRGWYSIAGVGMMEGYLLYDIEDVEELDRILQLYLPWISWDARPVYDWSNFAYRFEYIRRILAGAPSPP